MKIIVNLRSQVLVASPTGKIENYKTFHSSEGASPVKVTNGYTSTLSTPAGTSTRDLSE
jgi:hypothetical protein